MSDNATFMKDGQEIKRQVVQCYTRIMWYLRPIGWANIWKKSEIYSRKYFKEGCFCQRDFDRIEANQKFIEQYKEIPYTRSVL